MKFSAGDVVRTIAWLDTQDVPKGKNAVVVQVVSDDDVLIQPYGLDYTVSVRADQIELAAEKVKEER